jgi:hypothetical protein
VTSAHHPASVEACSLADENLSRAFDFLGRRWNAAILGALNSGPSGSLAGLSTRPAGNGCYH